MSYVRIRTVDEFEVLVSRTVQPSLVFVTGSKHPLSGANKSKSIKGNIRSFTFVHSVFIASMMTWQRSTSSDVVVPKMYNEGSQPKAPSSMRMSRVPCCFCNYPFGANPNSNPSSSEM